MASEKRRAGLCGPEASEKIDAMLADLGDWRVETLGQLRQWIPNAVKSNKAREAAT